MYSMAHSLQVRHVRHSEGTQYVQCQ